MVHQLPAALRPYIDSSLEHGSNGLVVSEHRDKGRKSMDADAFLTVNSRVQLAEVLRIAGEEGFVVTPRAASSSTGVVALPGGKDGGFLAGHEKLGLLGVRLVGGEFGPSQVRIDVGAGTAWVPPGVSQAQFRQMVLDRSDHVLTSMEYQTDPSAEVVAAKMAGSVDDDGHGVHNNATRVDLMYGHGGEDSFPLTPTDYFGVSSFSRLAEVGGNVIRAFDGRGAPGFLATGVEVPLAPNRHKVRLPIRIAKGSYSEMLEKLARVNHLLAQAAVRMHSSQSGLKLTSAEFMDTSTIELVRKLEKKKDFAPGEAEGVGLIVYPEFELIGPNANLLLNDLEALLEALGASLDFDELTRLGELLPPLTADQVGTMDVMRQDLPEAGRADKRAFKATTDPAVNPLRLDESLALMRDVAGIAEDVLLEDPDAGIYIYGHGPRNGVHARIGTNSRDALQAHERGSLDMSRRLIDLEKRGSGVARFRAEKPLQGGIEKDRRALAYGMTAELLDERRSLIRSFDPRGVLLLSEIETHRDFSAMVASRARDAHHSTSPIVTSSGPRSVTAK